MLISDAKIDEACAIVIRIYSKYKTLFNEALILGCYDALLHPVRRYPALYIKKRI